MTAIVVSMTVFVGLLGLGFTFWSFNRSRNETYEDYIKRKRSPKRKLNKIRQEREN